MFRESETNLTSRLISEPSSGETSETLLSTISNLHAMMAFGKEFGWTNTATYFKYLVSKNLEIKAGKPQNITTPGKRRSTLGGVLLLVKRVLLADNPRFSTKKTCLQVVNFESAFDVFKVSILLYGWYECWQPDAFEGDRGVDHSGCEALQQTLDGSRKVGGWCYYWLWMMPKLEIEFWKLDTKIL